MLKINLSKQAQRFIKTMHPEHAKQIARKLLELQLDPMPHDTKKLMNSDYLRTDIGEYRIIYRIQKEPATIEVIIIGKRNDDGVYTNRK